MKLNIKPIEARLTDQAWRKVVIHQQTDGGIGANNLPSSDNTV